MKDLVSRMQAQLNALVKKYPAAAAELELSFELNAGASEADFAELEQTLGYALPEEFKELYRVANGEADIGSVFAGEEWLSIERIIDEYNIWQELYQMAHSKKTTARPTAASQKQASSLIFGGIPNGFRFRQTVAATAK